MLTKVISGAQAGADRAGLDAAIAAGIPIGGWVPKGRLAEDGPVPAHYPLTETESDGYPERTRRNVQDSDATLTFEVVKSPGTNLTYRECDRQKKPYRCVMLLRYAGIVYPDRITHAPQDIADWLRENNVRVLNIAGNRESKAKGVGVCVRKFLAEVFRLLKED